MAQSAATLQRCRSALSPSVPILGNSCTMQGLPIKPVQKNRYFVRWPRVRRNRKRCFSSVKRPANITTRSMQDRRREADAQEILPDVPETYRAQREEEVDRDQVRSPHPDHGYIVPALSQRERGVWVGRQRRIVPYGQTLAYSCARSREHRLAPARGGRAGRGRPIAHLPRDHRSGQGPLVPRSQTLGPVRPRTVARLPRGGPADPCGRRKPSVGS